MFAGGDYLPLLYGDWMAHAYRALFMQQHGLATWDHNWSGGISLFRSYQIVPTAATALFSELANLSVGRGMLLLEGLLLVSLAPSAYLAARVVGLPPLAALLAGTIMLTLNNYALPTSSFSILWGLALMPLLVAAIFRFRDRPAIYPLAALAGFGVYVHPHLAEVAALALVSAFLAGGVEMRRAGRLALQGCCFLLATAFYWVPAFLSARPGFEGQYSASAEFMRTMFRGEVRNFSPLAWVVLAAAPLFLLLLWRFARQPLARYASVFYTLLLALIALSYFGVGPETFRLAQNVRLVIVLPFALGLLAAIAGDAWLRAAPILHGGVAWAPAALIGAAAIVAVPSLSLVDHGPYEPASFGADPVNDWLSVHPSEITGRVWFDDLGTPWYTYRQFDEIRAAGSHFPVGEWSILAQALDNGVNSGGEFDTIEEYLKAMAVSHVVLPVWSPLVADLGEGGAHSGQLIEAERLSDSVIYRTPWEPVNAFVADAKTLPDLRFPRDVSTDPAQRHAVDSLVRRYSALAYSDAARPVAVEYPSPTTMQVRVESMPPGQYLVISENWDRSWHARSEGGKALRVDRYGPNFIGVDVSELSGNVVISLGHNTSADWKWGMALAAISLPVGIAAGAWEWVARRSRTG
jgi:hypothetical protein